MFAMFKPEFIQHSCYKFMFLLACIDMIAIPCDSIISGVQCIMGVHYCTHPIFFYVVGCGSIGEATNFFLYS
uniref:G protein-coupled receptor n=1 Tax=Acrobeloides nanus TaxID=290746 RepID=A0A914D1M1_9BILA